MRYGLGMGQEGHGSDSSRHGAVSVSTIQQGNTRHRKWVCVGTDQPHIPQTGTIMLTRYNGVKYIYRMGKNIRKDWGES